MRMRLILVAAIALAAGMIAIPVLVRAGAGIEIDSQPYIAAKSIYFDSNQDGADQPRELLGTYDVYNPQMLFRFHWTPLAGATYYRVSLVQYLPPGVGPGGLSQEVKIAHHSAGDPNGPRFSMSVLPGSACLDCVTIVRIVPETMLIRQNAKTGSVYEYTELPGELVSAPFVFEIPPRLEFPSGKSSPQLCPVCGDGVCSARESVPGRYCWCEDDCSVTP